MEISLQLLVRITTTSCLVCLIGALIRACEALILRSRRLRSRLRKQGIDGPTPSFLLGNTPDIRKHMANSSTSLSHKEEEEEKNGEFVHNCSASVFPYYQQWTKEYGPTFMFSLGNLQYLHVNDPSLVKEISTCTSLDLGKPRNHQKMLGPLLGRGLITSNGSDWTRQRRILGPEYSFDRIKRMNMMDLMAESAISLVNKWENEVESGGGIADIKVDEYLHSFSGDVISRTSFGSNYAKGEQIFSKLDALQQHMSKRFQYYGMPIMRYLPTKSNRETWRLEKEIRALILKVVKERKEGAAQNDVLQAIIDGALSNNLGDDEIENFVVDNCKNIYLAGYDTTAVSASWALMLLASNQEWQARARAEALDICEGGIPNSDMVRKMKTLAMVIQETLRLYPPTPSVSREALQDLKLGDIDVPKGVNVMTMMVSLHQDPEIWGPYAHVFNPGRFANGVSGACELPHVYMPFGAGPRVCLGQHFAMAELKILLALVLSKFSLSLSPSYRHSPVWKVSIRPRFGVNLLVEKL